MRKNRKKKAAKKTQISGKYGTIEAMKDRLILVSTRAGIVLNIILWLVLVGKFGISSSRVPLHYNVVYGIDFSGSSWKVYTIPFTGLSILLVNHFLAGIIGEREKVFAYLLSFAIPAVQLLLLVAGISLVALNV